MSNTNNKKIKVKAITPTELVSKTTTEPVVTTSSNIRVTTPHEEPKEVVTHKEEPKGIKLADSKTEIIVPVSDNKQTKMISPSVAFIRNYISGYLDYITGPGVKNAKDSISKFSRIVTYVLSHQEDEVLDEVFNFFKKNRKDILTPDTALHGIYYLSANQQDKIQQVYTLFEHITATRRAKKLDLDYASSVLGTGNLISYVAKRMI